MNTCEARGGYEKRGGCSLLQVRYEKWGGEGGACRTMIYILLCARARDSAWRMERGGGGGAAIGPRGRHFV